MLTASSTLFWRPRGKMSSLQMWDNWWAQGEDCAKWRHQQFKYFHMEMCQYFSPNAFRDVFNLSPYRVPFFTSTITAQNSSNRLSICSFLNVSPNLDSTKIIDPLNFVLIGCRIQIIELNASDCSGDPPCCLKHLQELGHHLSGRYSLRSALPLLLLR